MCSYRCRCQQLERQAEKHCIDSSLKRFFSHWHVQLLERRALKLRRVLLLSRYAHLWNSRQRMIQHNRMSAENLYTKVSLSECYNRVFIGANLVERYIRVFWYLSILSRIFVRIKKCV